jgi:hypothetical protein
VKLETGAMSMLGKSALCLVRLTHQNYLLCTGKLLGCVCLCVVVICTIISDSSYCEIVIVLDMIDCL